MTKGLALIRGIALGCAVTAFVFAVVLLLDLADAGSSLVFVFGALAGVAVGLLASSDQRIEALGSVLVGSGGIALGAVTGFGWLEFSMIAGSALAVAWLITGEKRPRNPLMWLRWGGIVIPLLVVVLLPLILDGGALGHDESAYAVKARQWLDGTPGTGWSPHRGIGMSIYGYFVLALGGKEPGLRMLGLAGVVALCAGTWALGRQVANTRVGAVAALAVVAGPEILRRSSEYLSDVPATALLTFCMVIVWREFKEHDPPTYGLLWSLPLAWGAFYLRYQSALSLVLIALTALWLWWPQIRRRPGPLVWLIVIGALGLIPHFVQSIALTGEPWGILLNTTGGAVRDFVGEGLGDYGDQFWWSLAGWVGPIALVAALLGMLMGWRSRDIREHYLFLLIPAIAQVIALGLISHGEPRFVFFPVALVVVAGSMAFDGWVSANSSSSWFRSVSWALAILIAGSLAISATDARASVRARTASNEPVELAAVEVADQSGGHPCGVLTSYTPQITFYSGCASEIFVEGMTPQDSLEALSGEARFMVLIENGKRQPVGQELAGLVALTLGSTVVEGEKRSGTVYVFSG